MTRKKETNKATLSKGLVSGEDRPVSRTIPEHELEKLLLDLSPTSVFVIDYDGNCVFQNLSAQMMLYLAKDKQANVIEIIPEIDLNRVRSCIKERGNYNIFFERAQRSYRMVIRGLPELGIAGVYGSDITDLTRIEADMLRSQNILRKVLDTDPNMIFVKDIEGRFVLVNQAVAEVYGTTVDNLIGKRDSDFNPHSDEVVHFKNDDLEVIKSQKEKRILEESVTDVFGNSRFFSTVKRPLQLTQTEDSFVLGVSTDISAVKRLQEQLAQASKMEALGQLAGGIAHDFNNLLTAILGYADILKITHSTDEKVVEPASMIQVAADRAKRLTEQLLGFARQGKQQNIFIDMHALISDTLGLLKRTIDQSIHVEAELSALKPYINGDPIQMQQVIMNLAINARDAVLTACSSDVPKIEIRTHNLNDVSDPKSSWLEIEFVDNGCGMSPDVQSKIFDPFFTTKEVGKGTGLGLSTAYGIVRNHEGEIRVESEVNEGTRFFIRLPCVANASKAERPALVKSISTVGEGTVLLVDDHPEVLGVATSMLKTLGFKVIACSSGAEAASMFRAQTDKIDVAVVDLIMPGMSGIETIDAIQKIRPGLPILVVSGFAQSEMLETIVERGYKFLRKPFELEALSEAISEALSGSTPKIL